MAGSPVRNLSSLSVEDGSSRCSSSVSSESSVVSLPSSFGSEAGSDRFDGRVILRMEVSASEHAFLIGNNGENIKKIKDETSCVVHCPEQNGENSSKHPHLHQNEVSIRGKLPNVIIGCCKIRGMIPFQFILSVSQEQYNNLRNMQLDFQIASFRDVWNITTEVKLGATGNVDFVVRGPQTQRTLQGAEAVVNQFSRIPLAPDNAAKPIEVTVLLAIHPHSQSAMWTLCQGEAWLRKIANVAKVTISFPDPKTSGGDRQTVRIVGPVRQAAAAWLLVMSVLPVTLRVFVTNSIDYQKLENHITNTLNVNFLAPRRDPRPEDKPYVEYRSCEGNMANIVEAAKLILGETRCSVPSLKAKFEALELDFALSAIDPIFSSSTKTSISPTRSEPSSSSSHTTTHSRSSSQQPAYVVMPVPYFMMPPPMMAPFPFYAPPVMPPMVPPMMMPPVDYGVPGGYQRPRSPPLDFGASDRGSRTGGLYARGDANPGYNSRRVNVRTGLPWDRPQNDPIENNGRTTPDYRSIVQRYWNSEDQRNFHDSLAGNSRARQTVQTPLSSLNSRDFGQLRQNNRLQNANSDYSRRGGSIWDQENTYGWDSLAQEPMSSDTDFGMWQAEWTKAPAERSGNADLMDMDFAIGTWTSP